MSELHFSIHHIVGDGCVYIDERMCVYEGIVREKKENVNIKNWKEAQKKKEKGRKETNHIGGYNGRRRLLELGSTKLIEHKVVYKGINMKIIRLRESKGGQKQKYKRKARTKKPRNKVKEAGPHKFDHKSP